MFVCNDCLFIVYLPVCLFNHDIRIRIYGSVYVSFRCTYLHNSNTQSEVRSHFGCSSLVGAELENQGGSATIGSHWEKRIFEVIWKRHTH